MPRADVGDRLRQLLAMLPWLAARGGASVAEVAERFGLGQAEVVATLELAACCGLPPYTPDQLMELIVSDDWVEARLGPHLSRPRRLSAAEGFTLAASARAILAVPGADADGALAGALAKLEQVLGSRLDVGLDEPPQLAAVRLAAEEGRPVELDYYSASRDERTQRRVDPWSVFARDGHWYLDGWCELAGGRRLFRVDRIRGIEPAGPAGSARKRDGDPSVPADQATRAAEGQETFIPGPETRTVTLLVPAEGRWVAESYPTEEVEELADGRLRIRLSSGGMAWLERLLLRLGPEAQVADPPDLADAGRGAARRLLERYA